MKMILLFAIFVSWALEASTLNYKTIEMSTAPLEQAEKLDFIFSDNGFYSLAETGHGIPGLGINQVYYKTETQFVLVKYGIEGSYPMNEIIQTPKGYMIYKKEKDLVYMMYFRGFNIDYVNIIVRRIETKITNYQKIQNFLISSAFADACSVTGAPLLAQSSELSGISAAAAWGSLKSCMSGVGEGVYGSTIGVVKGVGKELWAFASNPIDYTEAVADKVELFLVKTAKFIKQLVAEPDKAFAAMGRGLGKTWQTVKSGVLNMSTEMKINFVCSLIGSLGVDAAIAFLSGGAASGKVAVTIANIAKKFEMLGKMLSVLSKFKLEGAKLEKLMKGLFSNRYPEGDLRHLDALAVRSDELSLRTLSCYLH